jgi:hypothetical protein
VAVNEHPLVEGVIATAKGYLEHHDSPDLDHWLTKQNRYTTAEAASQFEGRALALPPRFFGSALERRMWFKRNFWKVPGRYVILFLYHLLFLGAWRAGRVGSRFTACGNTSVSRWSGWGEYRRRFRRIPARPIRVFRCLNR